MKYHTSSSFGYFHSQSIGSIVPLCVSVRDFIDWTEAYAVLSTRQRDIFEDAGLRVREN